MKKILLFSYVPLIAFIIFFGNMNSTGKDWYGNILTPDKYNFITLRFEICIAILILITFIILLGFVAGKVIKYFKK